MGRGRVVPIYVVHGRSRMVIEPSRGVREKAHHYKVGEVLSGLFFSLVEGPDLLFNTSTYLTRPGTSFAEDKKYNTSNNRASKTGHRWGQKVIPVSGK